MSIAWHGARGFESKGEEGRGQLEGALLGETQAHRSAMSYSREEREATTLRFEAGESVLFKFSGEWAPATVTQTWYAPPRPPLPGHARVPRASVGPH